MSANPSHPGLTWNAAGSIGCFISDEPPVASPDANHVGLALIRLSQELGLDALEKLNGSLSSVRHYTVKIDKLTSLELLHRVLLD